MIRNLNSLPNVLSSVARHTLRFSTDKIDTMVIQAVNLLETVDKELNSCTQRVREWYGWHFPELAKIITEPLDYVYAVRQIGSRQKFNEPAKKDTKFERLNEMMGEENFEALKIALQTSIGLDISEEDEEHINALCDQAIELAQYRVHLANYLKQRMSSICPNMSKVLGDVIGAKLLAHAGSLANLAKKAGSTVQIFGAEKALFRAIKTRTRTPKYGLLYNAPLIMQTGRENKGKVIQSAFFFFKCFFFFS